MQQVLDENALPHVAAHVKTQAGEVTATQIDQADPGGLGLKQENKRVDCYTGDENSTTLTTGVALLRVESYSPITMCARIHMCGI